MRNTDHQDLLKLALMLTLMITAWLGTGPALGADLFIYPNMGQSPEQLSRDRDECHLWAVQQTGIDPTRPQASAPPSRPLMGGVFGGAARGAAVGVVGGAITGNAGTGAAVGAATGGLVGGMRQRGQAQANQAAQQQSAVASYNRALSACLSGRGYTVR
jgi:predicted lipid-binding transport protein (Tim44 family)